MGCYIWYSDEGPGRAAVSPGPLLAVPNALSSPAITRLCSENANLRNQPQPKVIRGSEPDFWINPDLGPGVCRITPKMLWIQYLVDVTPTRSAVKIAR